MSATARKTEAQKWRDSKRSRDRANATSPINAAITITASDGPTKQCISSDAGEKEDAIIQVVDVGALQEEIEIWNFAGHDQEDGRARREEREDETEQGPSGKPMGRSPMSCVFSGHERLCHGVARGIVSARKIAAVHIRKFSSMPAFKQISQKR